MQFGIALACKYMCANVEEHTAISKRHAVIYTGRGGVHAENLESLA